MRLICGIVHLDGAPAQADTLARMVDALTTPGLAPHVARRVEGPAALAVLDFSSHRHVSADRWLAADVRLDRPRALAAALGLSERSGEEALVLAALDKWGEDLPDQLDGDFALAAWEPRQRRLTCARDFMGVRPLCYTHKPGQLFAFASLPRGLHASGVAARRLDRVALGRLQFESYPTGVSTGFEDISWLPAGHSLTVTPEALRMHRAWRPDPAQVGQRRCSATDAAATLRGLLEDAVRNRLPADGPVAAHLSGGLDSSAIVVMAAREMRARNGGPHTGRCSPIRVPVLRYWMNESTSTRCWPRSGTSYGRPSIWRGSTNTASSTWISGGRSVRGARRPHLFSSGGRGRRIAFVRSGRR